MTTPNTASAAAPPPLKDDNQLATEFRQRRTATFVENNARTGSPAHAPTPPPPLNRRSSSFVTNTSLDSGRFSLTDDLLAPRATGEQEEFSQEPDHWHSLPLLFAIVPAIGGTVFKKGSVFVTDFSLLVLAGLYLNWCLRTPWVWYHSAQSTKVLEPPIHESVFEESREDLHAGDEREANGNGDATPSKERRETQSDSKSAGDELRMHELAALTLCFLGPLLGSYILHLVRTQLSEIGDQLVSNMHLTLFVLAAEIRPLRYLMKMVQARTLYLQRVVRSDPSPSSPSPALTDLRTRLTTLETAAAAQPPTTTTSPTAEDAAAKKHHALQSQIDALNRAVRRYEKRATAQTIQTEARLQELETQLRNALTLAATAADYSQRPSTAILLLGWARGAVVAPLRALWAALTYPVRAAGALAMGLLLRVGLVRYERRGKPAGKQTTLRSRTSREDLARRRGGKK